jgi:hypothetical protein
MDDLANERQAVIEAILRFNLEPVNAEAVLPTGATSWEVLADEIRSSHICVFLQGDRYGWVPTNGYGGDQGKSVSHLEVDFARENGIPILPFFKRLKYGADATSEDAIRRDKFRRDIEAWNDGQFRAEFNLASDLRDKVSSALLDLFTGSYLHQNVRAQGQKYAPGSSVLTFVTKSEPRMPRQISGHQEVLLAGAGLSLSAGYPSANALADMLWQTLGLSAEQKARHSLAQLFEFAQETIGRQRVLEIVRKLMNPPLPVEPTLAHMGAVQRFSTILTTNYDTLFEQACRMLNLDFIVHLPLDRIAERRTLTTVEIYKIDGSIEQSESLVLTPDDTVRARTGIDFWSNIEALLQSAAPIVMGHSLRDETTLSLMSRRNLKIEGVYVAPVIDSIDQLLLLKRLNLKSVQSTASAYILAEKS